MATDFREGFTLDNDLEIPTFSEDELIELSILRGQEIDELVEHGLLPQGSRFDEELLNTLVFPHPEVSISLHTGWKYPAEQLEIGFDNRTLPRLVMDALRIDCRKIIIKEAEKNNFKEWSDRELGNSFGVFNFEMTALHVAQKIEEHLNKYRDLLKPDCGNSSLKERPQTNGIKNGQISEDGIDISTIAVDATASSVLGKLPEEICSMIPENFRILHVESVIRQNLYQKFKDCQNDIWEDLRKFPKGSLKKCVPLKEQSKGRDTVEELAKYLATPKLTFHGTSNRFVPSIVRYGFLAPGSKHPETHVPLPVRCGSTYGRGIYSSPDAEFSLAYSGSEAQPTSPDGFWGMKLIVCATIMGRPAQMTRDDEWWLGTKPYEGAHSHVGNYEKEYIVFNNAQILPCYVIHLDWGVDNAQFFRDISQDRGNFVSQAKAHPRLSNETIAPGDRQRQKQALIAKASKYFPYGYGPASGTSFVIEDVGEIDDDEEEYGEYQKDRIDSTNEDKNIWKWNDGNEAEEIFGGSKFDEYGAARSGSTRT